jgi:hypothetical protein
VLDIELPGISRLELQRRLALSEWRNVPIIVITAIFGAPFVQILMSQSCGLRVCHTNARHSHSRDHRTKS